MTDRKTILFFPEPGAWGPTNNCVAIAEVLRERGHRAVFVVDASFYGVLDGKGFEERVMRMAPPEEDTGPTADPWAEFIRVIAPEFRKPTIEQQVDRDQADLGGARRRRAVRARPADGDLGRRPPRRRVHRQRHRLSRRRARQLPVGPVRVDEPARDA